MIIKRGEIKKKKILSAEWNRKRNGKKLTKFIGNTDGGKGEHANEMQEEKM